MVKLTEPLLPKLLKGNFETLMLWTINVVKPMPKFNDSSTKEVLDPSYLHQAVEETTTLLTSV